MTLLIVLLSLAFNTAMSDLYREAAGDTMTAYILIGHHFMLMAAGYGAVHEGRISDSLAYMLGIGFVLHHIVAEIELYLGLYGSGDILGMSTVVMAYLVLPGGYMLAPLLYGGGRAVQYRRVIQARAAAAGL